MLLESTAWVSRNLGLAIDRENRSAQRLQGEVLPHRGGTVLHRVSSRYWTPCTELRSNLCALVKAKESRPNERPAKRYFVPIRESHGCTSKICMATARVDMPAADTAAAAAAAAASSS